MIKNRFQYLFARYDGTLPVDLLSLVGYVILADIVIIGLPETTEPLRILLGIPLIFFVPGYAILAALFPQGKTERDSGWRLRPTRGLNVRERALFSFGLSFAVLPLLAMMLSASDIGIGSGGVIASVSFLGGVGALVGTIRRQRLDPTDRFELPVHRWVDGLATAFTGSKSITNLVLVVAVIFALSSLAYGLSAPMNGEEYTDFSLLSPTDDGNLVASDYPSTLSPGETETVVVGVSNHEERVTKYTVVVQLQRIRTTGDEIIVEERSELDRATMTLDPDERWRKEFEIDPQMKGEDLRIQFLLYRDEPPDIPSAETAYRKLHFWVSVTEPESNTASLRTNTNA